METTEGFSENKGHVTLKRSKKWISVEDLRPHLQPIVNEVGRMPTENDLIVRNRTDLTGVIRKFGGYPKVAEALVYPYTKRNSWKSIDDLRPHLQQIVDELGRVPTDTELQARNRGDLMRAIRKFGGQRKVAEALGYIYKGYTLWQSVEDLRPHLQPIVDELGRMPGQLDLKARKRFDLVDAVHKFGGHAAVAQALGYLYTRNSWTNVEDLRPHLQPLVDELGCMPNLVLLEARGYDHLRRPIELFGGQATVAEALGYLYTRRSWTSIEDLHPHLQLIVDELGYMPGQLELKARNRLDLANAIKKFGGFAKVARFFGYLYEREEPKSWKNVEDLRPYLQSLVDELGRMPSTQELEARGRHDVLYAIHKFGGFAKVAELLGYTYHYAPALEQLAYRKKFEAALLQLHQSQSLSAGQIMLILRHAGLLSERYCKDILRHFNTGNRLPSADLDAEFAAITVTIEKSEDSENPGDKIDNHLGTDDRFVPFIDIVSPTSSLEDLSLEDELGREQKHLPRDRAAEVKELRGWSAVGNLLDPTPALLQLSVTRLKTAFYRFANEQRMSLEAPSHEPSLEDIEQLKARLWEAAFGEYGELINNEFVQEACQMYITDLAGALLLPRIESTKIPRLYQLDGARFLASRLSSPTQPYGLLFDQPGMGKTLTTLWALAATGATRFVIVAPLTVKRQVWTFETLQTAFPQMKETQVIRTLDMALGHPGDEPIVVLLHYEELRRHEEIHRLVAPRPDGSLPFDALIFDEAHTVKERLTTGSAVGPTREGAWLLRRGARACIGLTATPVVNELYEPVSLLDLMKEQREDSAGRRLQSRRLRDRVDVMEYLLADALRRLKEGVLFDIPARQIHSHPIIPTSEQLEQIQHFLHRGRHVVSTRLAEYRRLMLDAKLDWIESVVDRYLTAVTPDGQPDPKVLILCYNVEGISQAVYSRLVEKYGTERVAHVDGETSMADRDEALRRFRESADVATGLVALVGTVGTIGVGVTLFDPGTAVTPHRVIFADLPFTWAEFEQGVDRLHRVGQHYPVQVEVPIVSYGEQLLQADGEGLQSFDEWVWQWILRKQLLADQVLDAAFDVSEYKDTAIRRAITQALKDIEKLGGTLIAPPPPPDSEQALHRRLVGRYRALPRNRVAELFQKPGMSERFLALNDASLSAKLAQRLVRERLMRWLDKRSVGVDLGCGSNPLRDLPCAQVIGIDRHGVNGGLVGDSAATGLASAEADFVVFSLSMWGTTQDRLSYLQEAKRLLRPIGKLIIVEPAQTFGGAHEWKAGVARLCTVLEKLGMQIASASEHIVDTGTRLVAIVANNSNDSALDNIDPDSCIWADIE
jgi:superfamily II DNA or RNA helicase